MTTCQDITDEFIFDDTFINLRQNCFRQKLYSRFGNKNHSKFEYLCICLHTCSTLNRHFDYMNGSKPGCSYNFTNMYKNTTYRFNFIMCGRLVCDEFMNKNQKWIHLNKILFYCYILEFISDKISELFFFNCITSVQFEVINVYLLLNGNPMVYAVKSSLMNSILLFSATCMS